MCVHISPEPYEKRRLYMRRRVHTGAVDEVTVLVDELADVSPGTVERVIQSSVIDVTAELVDDKWAMLMTTTDWMVKAGAALSRSIAQCGGNAPLLLSRVLLPAHNPAIRRRNEQWQAAMRASQADSE